jgi:hypothetical protein
MALTKIVPGMYADRKDAEIWMHYDGAKFVLNDFAISAMAGNMTAHVAKQDYGVDIFLDEETNKLIIQPGTTYRIRKYRGGGGYFRSDELLAIMDIKGGTWLTGQKGTAYNGASVKGKNPLLWYPLEFGIQPLAKMRVPDSKSFKI